MTADLHDPGGKTRLRLMPHVIGNAQFSPCGQYRYWLSRQLVRPDTLLGMEDPYALWIGMNPSTAEADVDDPTIRKELYFTTTKLKLYRYVKVNVMDYRATKPADLLRPGVQPCSKHNRDTIRRLAMRAHTVVACWGRQHPTLRNYAGNVLTDLIKYRVKVMSLGVNNDQSPKHPLYLPYSTELEPFC